MTNVLLPSNSGIERTNLFCPAGCGYLIRGIQATTGRALCKSCGYTVILDEAPESTLTDSKGSVWIVQQAKRNKGKWEELPAGAVVTEEFELS